MCITKCPVSTRMSRLVGALRRVFGSNGGGVQAQKVGQQGPFAFFVKQKAAESSASRRPELSEMMDSSYRKRATESRTVEFDGSPEDYDPSNVASEWRGNCLYMCTCLCAMSSTQPCLSPASCCCCVHVSLSLGLSLQHGSAFNVMLLPQQKKFNRTNRCCDKHWRTRPN